MDALQQIIPIVFTVSLLALVFSIGLDATMDDVLYMFRRPLDLLKAVTAVNIVVPVVALLLTQLLPLSPVAKAGIVLMAAAPVPPLVPGNQLKAGARKAYAYGVYVALITLAIVIVPITVSVLSATYGSYVTIGVRAVAGDILMTVLIPLFLGVALRANFPRLATRAGPWIGKAAMLLLIVALAPVLVATGPAMVALVGNGTLLAIVLMVATALAAGHLLGGPDLEDRAALAVTAATRHPGLAIMIAGANSDDKRITAAILAVTLVGLIVMAPYRAWVRRRQLAAVR